MRRRGPVRFTLYGTVWQVEADRVQVRGAGGGWPLWVERWRVIVY
ncbi:hypothetical protein ACIPX0_43705 [Streptomyces sp. NPDC090075]